MDFPSDLKYTKEHEWVRMEGDLAVVGITEFAQSELGDVVFVDLPEVGATVEQFGNLCVVESTKAASDVYSPVTGEVAETNELLENQPELINQDSYAEGWIVKIKGVLADSVSNLMSADEYKALVEG